jgi:hypothetical protein
VNNRQTFEIPGTPHVNPPVPLFVTFPSGYTKLRRQAVHNQGGE